MKEDLQAFSRQGRFKEKVHAFSITSREHARKLWPLVTPDAPHELVTYFSPSFNKETDELIRRSYFARLPRGKRKSIAKQFHDESTEWHKQRSESAHHRRAKELLAAELSRRIANSESLVWCFADPTRSDFPIKGDLLLGAQAAKMEHPFETPFDQKYKLDIAVLGLVIDGKPLILAGIEIELTHAFDGFKGLISKTLGFPMISVDITDMELTDLTPDWAAKIIQSTTLTDDEGRRKTYFYLHDLIYPQFVCYPAGLIYQTHHYLVFAPDEDISRLVKKVQEIGLKLGLTKSELVVQRVVGSNEQAKKQLDALGLVVGADWEEINPKQCLRIVADRPSGIDDLRWHQFHTIFARLLLAERHALVGYKYIAGVQNEDTAQDIWIHEQWQGADKEPNKYRTLPKRLAEPISSILSLIKELRAVEED